MTKGTETRYRVRGGNPLQGTVFVQGAKNAALKMIAASLLAEKGRTVLRNVPVIEDVRRAVELAQAVGAVVKFHEVERTLVVDASEADQSRVFRPRSPGSSARPCCSCPRCCTGSARPCSRRSAAAISAAGIWTSITGDLPGSAPTVEEGESQIHVKAPDGLRGAHLYLDTPSHTGTENLIMAASLAPGTT